MCVPKIIQNRKTSEVSKTSEVFAFVEMRTQIDDAKWQTLIWNRKQAEHDRTAFSTTIRISICDSLLADEFFA